MTRRHDIEVALRAWIDADRRLVAGEGELDDVMHELTAHRGHFRRLSAQGPTESMDDAGDNLEIIGTSAS
jgi:hypothetical protein